MEQNDLNRLKHLLNRFGVPFKIDINEEEPDEINGIKVYPKTIDIVIEDSCHEKVSSYSGFFIYFTFDKDRKFIKCGAGEG